MNGKIISSFPVENDISYRVEIYEDDAFMRLVGEANVIGSGSFSRERQYLNKAMIKRYAKSVANRRGPNYPWFISDELAHMYGITTELPPGLTYDMKPTVVSKGPSEKQVGGNNQTGINDFFINSSMGFLVEERSVSPSPPQFNFPCDDAIVPVELIDTELKYPELVPINQFISNSSDLTRSLSIWGFCQTFSAQLKLSPFSYDDWEEALTCTDPLIDSNPIVEETFLALLFTLMKDRRNLTKGAFADKLKSAVLTFKPEHENTENTENTENNSSTDYAAILIDGSASALNTDDIPEIIISSADEEEEVLFVKRPRKSSISVSAPSKKPKPKSLLLPSIDLRKHRWYESKAMEYWHFVLGSFFLELIDMISQFIAEEQAKSESEASENSGSDSDSNSDGQDDSEYEEGKSDNESLNSDEAAAAAAASTATATAATDETVPKLKQLNSVENPLEVMQNFIKIYEPIVENLTGKGSKEMFSSYLNLRLSSKLALIEFLIHNHFDREVFKTFVEDCLERQVDSRRHRKESEQEMREALKELEKIEAEVQRIKEENLKITQRLEADESEIEMSGSESEIGKIERKRNQLDNTETTHHPLTEKEKDELVEKRAVNKKEIAGHNAILRKLRPEVTFLQKKADAANRDLRKCSSFRTFPLGIDRQNREYWWYGEFVTPLGRLLIFDPTHCQWQGAIDTENKFDSLMEWLNPLGIREAKLKANLIEIEDEMRASLSERDLPDNLKETETVKGEDFIINKSDSEEEEVDFEAFRRGRGRPPKGSTSSNSNPQIPTKRPFQKYKNTN
jgi:hypothetical protein